MGMAGSGYTDYFQVLGVDRSADANAIKKAFRGLARKYHPDVNPGDQLAEARFKEISEAYEVLSDPDKRRKYEQFGVYWNQAGGMGGGAPGTDVDFGRYGNFDDFVNDLLGRFGGPGGGGFQGSGFPSGGFPGGSPVAPPPPGLRSISMPKPPSTSVLLRLFVAANAPCRSITNVCRCASPPV